MKLDSKHDYDSRQQQKEEQVTVIFYIFVCTMLLLIIRLEIEKSFKKKTFMQVEPFNLGKIVTRYGQKLFSQ